MKFVFILFLLICEMQAYAITPSNPAAIAQADSLVWKDYVGKYKGIEGFFENLIVSVEDDKLMGEATGQGKGQLVADTKADTFNVPGYDAIIIFIRDADHKVIKYRMQVQGQEFEGEKIE